VAPGVGQSVEQLTALFQFAADVTFIGYQVQNARLMPVLGCHVLASCLLDVPAPEFIPITAYKPSGGISATLLY
jgi:hypothetical protein